MGKTKAKIKDYSVDEALALVDRRFDVDSVMREKDTPLARHISDYYRQSRWGYERYNKTAAMHLSLSDSKFYDNDGLKAQAREVIAEAQRIGAKRILELGCGQAFNSRVIAEALPDVEVVATDLLDRHIELAREKAAQVPGGLPNFSARQASFTDLPKDIGSFDIIFGVETLCHTPSIDDVVREVQSHLAPGGTFLMHDAFRKADWDSYPEALKRSLVVNEMTMAVQNGYAVDGVWEAKLKAAGFEGIETTDLTAQTLGTANRLGRMGLRYMTELKFRLLHRVVPKHLSRNAVAGFLGYYLLFGDSRAPSPEKGITRYLLIRATKPA